MENQDSYDSYAGCEPAQKSYARPKYRNSWPRHNQQSYAVVSHISSRCGAPRFQIWATRQTTHLRPFRNLGPFGSN